MKKNKSKKRRFILTEIEQQFYYQRPIFDDEERTVFFALNNEVERALIKNRSPLSALYAILQFGYFKAKFQFFQVTYPEVQYDLQWIQQNYFTHVTLSKKLPSRNIQSDIKNKIAAIMGYQTSISPIKTYLVEQANFFSKLYNDPIIIFKELFFCLKQNKMVLPGYTTMQEIISQATIREKARLFQWVDSRLTPPIKGELDSILNSDDKLNTVRELKQDLSGFNYTAMKKEIYLHQSNQTLYQFAKSLLPDFQISEQNIHYYAECINYYSSYDLKQFPKLMCYLYLLCYLYHRHQKMNDNLSQALMYHVDKLKKAGSSHASAIFSKQQKTLLADPTSIGILLGNYANESLLRKRKTFNAVAKQAYKTMPKEKIAKVASQLMNQDFYKDTLEWQYYEKHSQFMKLNLRPILNALTFEADNKDHPLLEAICFLKGVFEKNTPLTKIPSSLFPQKVIPKKYRKIIIDHKGNIRPYHYEFLVYYKIKDYLVKNIIYLNDSTQYKSFYEDAKINLEGGNKELLLKKINKPKLLMPIKDRLITLEKEIEELFIEINKNIANGSNKSVRIKTVNEETTWNLKYPSADKEFNHRFYGKLPITPISDVFDFTNAHCDFIDVFKHFQVKNVKGELDYQAIKADIIAEGTRQGIVGMASRCNLDLETLRGNKRNYIREKTIRAACKKIIKKMSQLPIAKRYMIQGKHFCSVDGSKKGTAKKIALARYSPKYFGLSRGLSVMSMLMDNMLVNSNCISCNEYEGHHLYDIYFNHDAEFAPDIITMDSHGSNKMNWPLFDVIDIELFICYKNIFEKAKQLCGFKPLESYEGMLIKPSKRPNIKLIISQDEKIRDIFVTILSKTTKQSTLIKKLCNHGRKTVLKKALWEYNNILFTKSLLTYINNSLLQKQMRKSLNRVEASNKFYNTLVKIGGKKFKGKSERDIGIENQATRLLMLIISFYNMYILSVAIEQKTAQKDDEAVKILENISCLAIQHLNLSGMYHYGDSIGVNIDDIIKALTNALDNFCDKKKEANEPVAKEKGKKNSKNN